MTERPPARTRTAEAAGKAHPPASAWTRPGRAGPVLGNQARLRRLAAPVLQAKLEVGAADDPLEREADAVAERVMAAGGGAPPVSAGPAAVSRKCAECEDEQKADPLRREAAGGDSMAGRVAPPIVGETLSRPGAALDAGVSAFMSREMGHDFSAVRVHTDAAANASAKAVGARAYTVGSDVVFANGRYAPGAAEGRRLIAHELAHVVQQGGAGATAPGVIRRDGPDVPIEENKAKDASTALGGGLKTIADQVGKDDKFKTFGLALADRYAGPIWRGASDADKAAMIAGGTAIVGAGLTALLADPLGRKTLSGVNFLAPLSLVPYATLSGFSFDLPTSTTAPTFLHFSFKGDDLIKLAHDKLGVVPPITVSLDMTLGVGPDGKVTFPSAVAKFGVDPGVTIGAGFGAVTALPPLVAGPDNQLTPDVSFPQAAAGKGPGGVAVFATVDLTKASFVPAPIRNALGAVVGDRK